MLVLAIQRNSRYTKIDYIKQKLSCFKEWHESVLSKTLVQFTLTYETWKRACCIYKTPAKEAPK